MVCLTIEMEFRTKFNFACRQIVLLLYTKQLFYVLFKMNMRLHGSEVFFYYLVKKILAVKLFLTTFSLASQK